MPAQHMESWFIFQGDRLLLVHEALQLPNAEEIQPLKTLFLRQHTIGQFNTATCYCAELPLDAHINEPMHAITLRKAFDALGVNWLRAAVKAFSVINWDRTHQYCGRCGNPTFHRPHTLERICSACGLTFYPRISPSMIVLICKGEEILMARSAHFPKGMYGLVAGFLEVGESIEDAVHREIKEEVGLEVTNLHYFGSQSWPFPDSLMIGFIADYASGELTIDHRELEDAGWYRYDNLPSRPSPHITIAGRLIDYFIKQHQQKS